MGKFHMMDHHHHEGMGDQCGCGGGIGKGMGQGYSMMKKNPMTKITMKASKKLLKSKIEVELDKRYGKQFDEIAKDMVDMMADKMKMKADMMKRKMEMKDKMMADIRGIFEMEE